MKEAYASGRPCYQFLRFDKQGCAEVPFATASGKLRARLDGEKVLLDRNDDGKFDQADGEAVAAGMVTEVPVKLAGKDLAYRLALNLLGNAQAGRQALLFSLVRLEAQAGPAVVRVYDANCNGRFGDLANPAGGDPGDIVQLGDKAPVVPLAKCVSLDGAIQELEVLNGGEAITLRPYTGTTAKFTVEAVEGWRVNATLAHAEKGFQTEAVSGASGLALPGTYRMVSVMSRSGAKSEAANPRESAVAFYGWGGAEAVRITEGENRLRFGPPLKLEFTASRSPADEASFQIADVALVGAGGERYRACNYGSGGGGAAWLKQVRGSQKPAFASALTAKRYTGAPEMPTSLLPQLPSSR